MANEQDQATAGAAAAIGRADAKVAELSEQLGRAVDLAAERGARIDALEVELAEARASLKAVRGHATRAKAEAALLREERSPTPRRLGRPQGRFGKAGEPYDPALAALAIGEEEELEIVASDGKAEIVALNPYSVRSDGWRRVAGGFLLREPVDLEPGEADVEVAGFALVTRGEAPVQVGWRELPEPVRVARNQKVRIENGILF